MNSSQDVLRKFETTAAVWREWLERYSEDEFAGKPDVPSWSIGQVYSHLIDGTRRYHLRQIGQCLEGKGTVHAGGKTFPGILTFALGSFLPVRIKVPPSDAYTPKQPAGLAAMKAGLESLRGVMRETAPRIATAAPEMKSAHPALGFLNAAEWYALIEMHFRHHMRQKRRIDQWLGR